MKGKHKKKPDYNQVLIIIGMLAALTDLIDKLIDLIQKVVKLLN